MPRCTASRVCPLLSTTSSFFQVCSITPQSSLSMNVKCVWVSRACTNIARVLLKYHLLMQHSLVRYLAFCSISMHNYNSFFSSWEICRRFNHMPQNCSRGRTQCAGAKQEQFLVFCNKKVSNSFLFALY